jgi:fumarate hydratase class II
MVRNVLESITLLARASESLARLCVDGVEPNVERLRFYAESSPAMVTALNPLVGYDRAAEVAKEAVRTGRSIRDIVLAQGLLTAAELDRALGS